MAIRNLAGQARFAVRSVAVTTGQVDADATAFIAAAGITDLTQAAAINTLVSDLKTYGIWSKMKALYPFVGGTATAHKFNLKDSRDLDAAYRLVFNGGWIHSSTGAKPNGSTGYADTRLNDNTTQTNNTHVSTYLRTDIDGLYCDIGVDESGNDADVNIYSKYNNLFYARLHSVSSGITNSTSSLGLFIANRTNSTQSSGFKNNNKTLLNSNSIGTCNKTYYIGAINASSYTSYSPRESAFSSIGDGLTDTEAANFYTAVQKFQTTLGRQVGTPYVSDSDAQSFLNVVGITDLTQATAINTLVTDLKAANIWTKMKALYPFVGGTATAHKFNLKDPRDLDVAFRLVFNGGWTHTSTGALPNGSNGYADTKLVPYSVLTSNNNHLSLYSNLATITDSSGEEANIIGVVNSAYTQRFDLAISSKDAFATPNTTFTTNNNSVTQISYVDPSKSGYYISNRTTNNNFKLFKNNSVVGSNTNTNTSQLPNFAVYIGGWNVSGATRYAYRRIAFSSIGDGLTDTESSAFYTAVQKFQTTLGRQIDIPLVSDADAQAFLTAAGITSYTQANAVNTLVVDLKAAGIWTKMKALYPFVGGTATAHKFNLKDPRDLDAAFRLAFVGGWTHTSTGAKPNGTNGYANTYLVPSARYTSNSISIGFYSRTNISENSNDIGSMHSVLKSIGIQTRWTDNKIYGVCYDDSVRAIIVNNLDSTGFFTLSRTTSTSLRLYKNETTLGSYTNTVTGSLPTHQINLGSYNGLMHFSTREQALAFIGDGLSETEAANFYTAVQKFNTSLGRQIGTPVYNTNGLVVNLDAGNANSYPGTGTTWFDLASGNNGTLVNGLTYDVNNGGSINFDGVNDYVVVSDTPFRFGNQFTFNLWFYWDGLNKTNVAFFGKRSGSAGNYAQYSMGINNGDLQYGGTGKVLFFYARVDGSVGGNDPLDISLTYTLPSTPGIYNVSVTMDATSQKMYINGTLVNTTNKNVSGKTYNITGRDLLIGASRDDAGTGAIAFLNGKIYSISAYGRTLSDSEVLQNFNNTRGRFGL
jgi:hypothetical protein